MPSELLGEPQSQRRGERQVTRVILVEDHAAFRDALTSLLNMQPDLEVVGHAGSLAEGRAALALEEVDVAVVDVFLPDGNGVELYWDKPREQWPLDADGNVTMYTRRLDLEGLLASMSESR